MYMIVSMILYGLEFVVLRIVILWWSESCVWLRGLGMIVLFFMFWGIWLLIKIRFVFCVVWDMGDVDLGVVFVEISFFIGFFILFVDWLWLEIL